MSYQSKDILKIMVWSLSLSLTTHPLFVSWCHTYCISTYSMVRIFMKISISVLHYTGTSTDSVPNIYYCKATYYILVVLKYWGKRYFSLRSLDEGSSHFAKLKKDVLLMSFEKLSKYSSMYYHLMELSFPAWYFEWGYKRVLYIVRKWLISVFYEFRTRL